MEKIFLLWSLSLVVFFFASMASSTFRNSSQNVTHLLFNLSSEIVHWKWKLPFFMEANYNGHFYSLMRTQSDSSGKRDLFFNTSSWDLKAIRTFLDVCSLHREAYQLLKIKLEKEIKICNPKWYDKYFKILTL